MSNRFAIVHPELIPEWSEKNLPLTPYDITYGSNKRYWWKGSCGHEWQASAKSRSIGEKCPICAGARVLPGFNDLATKRPDLVEEWSEKNGELKPTMVIAYTHKKVTWKGKCGHEWVASVKSRVQHNSGCPYCSHNIILEGFNDLATLFPEVAAEWSDRNLPLKPSMVAPFANRKVWWKCSKGHEWNTLISTRSYGSKCPVCSGITLLKGFNDFATTHPQLAEEWSDRNLPLTPDMVNEKSRKNVWWKCKVCGNEWRSVVDSRVKGTICPVCAERAVLTGYNDLMTTDPQIAAEWDYGANKGLLPTHISRNSMRGVWWKCSHGHSWKAKITDRTIEGKGCRICENEFQQVFPKLLTAFYARKKGLQVRFDAEESVGLPLEAYIPEERLAIESGMFEKGKKTERLKDYICSKRGIKLVRLTYKGQGNEEEYARKVKAVFRANHIYIQSDERKDTSTVRQSFFRWRDSNSTDTV